MRANMELWHLWLMNTVSIEDNGLAFSEGWSTQNVERVCVVEGGYWSLNTQLDVLFELRWPWRMLSDHARNRSTIANKNMRSWAARKPTTAPLKACGLFMFRCLYLFWFWDIWLWIGEWLCLYQNCNFIESSFQIRKETVVQKPNQCNRNSTNYTMEFFTLSSIAHLAQKYHWVLFISN